MFTIEASTTTDTERREIAELKDKAQNPLIYGKFVPPPMQATHPETRVPQPVEALLTEFAYVFPSTLPLGLPPTSE